MKLNPVWRQSAIATLTTISLSIGGAISVIYFAHAVGPAVIGAYYVFLAYLGIFNLLGDGGLGGAAVKRISESSEHRQFFSAYMCLRFILLAVSITILIIVEPYLKDLTESGMFYWLLLGLVVSAGTNITTSGIYGRGKVGVYQANTLFAHIFQTGIQIIAVFFGFEAAGLVGGVLAGGFATIFLNFRHLDITPAKFSRKHVSSLSAFATWTFLATSGSLVFSYADTILISYFMTTKDVGVYRVTFQLTLFALFTTTSLRTVLYPKMSRWSTHQDPNVITTALSRAVTYSLILAIPICAGGWVLGDQLLYYLYGSTFVEGTPALIILLIMQVSNVFMVLGTMSLSAIDRPVDAFKTTAIAAILNILLDVALIPVFGIVGAAIGTFSAITVNALLAIRILKRHIRVEVEFRALKNILFAASGMSAAIVLLRLCTPVHGILVTFGFIVLGALVYGITLLKLDHGIHDEIKKLAQGIGMPWPRWI